MTTIYGYGEDFLTLWVLTEKFDEFLRRLDDKPDSECRIYYRPSFGRAGGIKDKRSAQFGEFDAIVLTEDQAYLIESKWDGASFKDDRLVLAENQVRRHRVMQWYYENWYPDPQSLSVRTTFL